MEDQLDELLALAPRDGVFCAPPSLQAWVIVDRQSGLRIVNAPLFFEPGEAQAHIEARFHPEAASRLLVKQVRFISATRLY